MRFLLIITPCHQTANKLAAENKLAETVRGIIAEQKPEAVYFGPTDGQRTAYVVLNITDPSELPKFSEPWFLALGAKIVWIPVMNGADLEKAGPDIQQAAQKWGHK